MRFVRLTAEDLIDVLDYGDDKSRCEAACELGDIQWNNPSKFYEISPAQIRTILESTMDSERGIRSLMCDLICSTPLPNAEDAVIRCLRDADPAVKITGLINAGMFFKFWENPAMSKLVLDLTHASDDEVRYYAFRTLGYCKDGRFHHEFAAAVENESGFALAGVLLGIGHSGDARLLEAVRRHIRNPDETIARAACDALGDMGTWNDIEKLTVVLKQLEDEAKISPENDSRRALHVAVLASLLRLVAYRAWLSAEIDASKKFVDPHESASWLGKDDADPLITWWSQVKNKYTMESYVKEMLRSPQPAEHGWALKWIQRRGYTKLIPDIKEEMSKPRWRESAFIDAQVLCRLGDPMGIRSMIDLVRDRDPIKRTYALRALYYATGVNYLTDKDAWLRWYRKRFGANKGSSK